MSGIIKSVLALIGLLAVLSHPVTRQGIDAVAGFWSKAAVYRVAQFSVPAATTAAASVAAAPLAAELKAAEATLSTVEPEADAVQAGPGVGETAVDDAILPAPGAESSETDKAMVIYKEAEKDAEDE